MRMLLVDDDDEFIDDVTPTLRQIAGSSGDLVLAKSRASAIEKINEDSFYDLFILDLAIPTFDGQADEDVDHGMAVFYHAYSCSPRTPVYILTASDANPVAPELLHYADQIDVWGDGKRTRTVELKWKENLAQFFRDVECVARRVSGTDEIEISTGGRDLGLNRRQRRVLRVFARRRESCSCEVSVLAGGLSSSRVFRVIGRNDTGHIQIVAAGKIADIASVDDEDARFEQHLHQLNIGAYPPKIEVVRSGAGLCAGIFYRLLNAESQSLLSLLAVDSTRAAALVPSVQKLTAPWSTDVGTTWRTVADIRRQLVKDEDAVKLFEKFGLNWAAALEVKRIQTRWVVVHNDLHAGNVLVNSSGSPLLIDFSEVGHGAAPIDPVSLELCLLFHPECQQIRGSWPSIDTAAFWADRSKFTQGCPCLAFVDACRNWAHVVAAGEREIYAATYTYFLCQLQYTTTDKELIFVMLDAVRRAFWTTFD